MPIIGNEKLCVISYRWLKFLNCLSRYNRGWPWGSNLFHPGKSIIFDNRVDVAYLDCISIQLYHTSYSTSLISSFVVFKTRYHYLRTPAGRDFGKAFIEYVKVGQLKQFSSKFSDVVYLAGSTRH